MHEWLTVARCLRCSCIVPDTCAVLLVAAAATSASGLPACCLLALLSPTASCGPQQTCPLWLLAPVQSLVGRCRLERGSWGTSIQPAGRRPTIQSVNLYLLDLNLAGMTVDSLQVPT